MLNNNCLLSLELPQCVDWSFTLLPALRDVGGLRGLAKVGVLASPCCANESHAALELVVLYRFVIPFVLFWRSLTEKNKRKLWRKQGNCLAREQCLPRCVCVCVCIVCLTPFLSGNGSGSWKAHQSLLVLATYDFLSLGALLHQSSQSTSNNNRDCVAVCGACASAVGR